MKHHIKITHILTTLMVVLLSASYLQAQVNPPMSMYYLNEYLYNPAAAGKKGGFNLGASYQNNLAGSNGETLISALTLDYAHGKSGFGLYAYIDKGAPFLEYSSFAASYAYNLKTSEVGNLRFGISLGASAVKINTNDIVGDPNDPQIARIDDVGYVFDGDFGVNYVHNNKLNINAVLPNIRSLVYAEDKENVGLDNFSPAMYYFSASYKFTLDNSIAIAPIAMYRGIKDYDGILDAGVNVLLSNERLNLMALYHTNNNVSAGIGYNVAGKYQFQASYAMPINTNLRVQSYGAVELGVRLNFGK